MKDLVSQVLMQAPKIEELAKKYSKYESMFVLGRNILFPTA
jgi:glucosamine 6-phosphate synthetase-like amidotransferase/phosphosugar isomerase protein